MILYTQRFLLVISVLFGLQASTLGQDKMTIVTSASMIADMTTRIVGDAIEVKTIVPIGGDPHRYQPTPSDAQLVYKSDLIFINGLTFEGWIRELIENSGTKAKTITVTKDVEIIQSDTYKNSADPHAWMAADNGLIYIKNILDAVQKLMPEKADVFQENYDIYADELRKIDQRIQSMIETIPSDQRVLITSHDAFEYYGKRYGLQLEAIMGVSTEAEARTSDIARVVEVIRKNKVPAIFVESTINPKLIEQISRDNNVAIGGELYADSLGDLDSPAPTYIDMLLYNTRTIVNALKIPVSTSNAENRSETSSSMWIYILLGAIVLGVLPILISKFRNA